MKKKIFAVILAAVLVLSMAVPAFAAVDEATGTLKFNENGKFTIMNICDIQDTYPMNKTIAQFINEVLQEYKPDLVVLGGDNSVAPYELKENAIKEICDLFVNNETYFTFVFGNHDREQDYTNEELFLMYKLYGGKYCLAYDADPELTGVGTHNLLVYSSDMSKIAYNLYMFDSNQYVEQGYDCVHEDQIEWYKNTSNALKLINNGETVPAMAFQHIIVQDVCEELYFESAVDLGELGLAFDGVSYTYIPNITALKTGYIFEPTCPGYYNHGQFDAMVETGDIVAIYSGHDHQNSFVVEKDGIDIINTPGCTFHSYGLNINRGARIIELDENDTSTYKTYMATVSQQALKEGSRVTEFGDISEVEAYFAVMLDTWLEFTVQCLATIFSVFNIFG